MTEIDVDLVGLPAMTKKELVSVALKHGGFATPSLNDTLYLHFKGYRRIENLDEFTGLKSIWLHSNGFGKIENLSHLTELRCLFLQSNCIATIENLEGLNSLVQLDLSENNIRFVQGLSHLPQLTTLNLSKNALKDAESISHLKECKALSSLDLSKNDLVGEDIVDCLAGISKLTSLNMAGNPAVSKIAFFRKKMIVASETLRYLDRPVEDHERTAVKAWAVGGVEAETKAKEEWVQANKEKQRLGLAQFREWKSAIKSDSPPRHFIAGPELPPREDLDDIVSYCEELKTAYQSNEERVGVAGLQDPGTERVGIAALDEESESASAPFIEVISESVCLNPENKVVVEESSMASGQKEPSSPEGMSIQDEDEMGAEVFNVKRIRDSIAIMKQSNSTKMTMMNTGWTQEMDEFLINKAEEYGYDFEAVAAGMAEQFDLAGVEQTADVCERRFSLIDLPVQADSVNELSVSEVLNFPSSDKPLASYVNENGSRKTIDQLRRDSEPVSISPLSLPTCTYDDMESDEGPGRALGRREIFDSIESSHEQKSSL